MSNNTTALIATVLATLTTGCMTGSDAEAPLSYDEFKAKYIGTWTDGAGNERFAYDWDQPLESEAQVEKLYDAYVSAKQGGATLSEATVNLSVMGQIDRWPAAQAQNLTYCVSDSFGANKAAVVSAMNTAAAEWFNATAGKVKYSYQSQYDASCNTSTPVVFDVSPGTQSYATAFFPSWTRDKRSVLIHPDTFNASIPPEGILRHELGHTLGLRHETIRGEGAAEYGFHCFENVFYKPLTAYDDLSVMTTPACMGPKLKNKTLSLSALDVQGIRALYP